MAGTISRIFELLGDGEWHDIAELQREMKIDKQLIERITLFLKDYQFLVVDESKMKAKLDEIAMEFLQASTS
jgi:hypothetical protein